MPWSTEDLKRLVELEAHQQNVDPRLAQAVVSQESEWNPNAVGDNGNSIGLFQLQPAAAKDAGLHPRFRSDPAENIKAGVTYLGQKLKQSGGNVEQALSRYNRGTPDYRGIGDPNYVQNVLRYYPDYQPSAHKPGMLARVGQALSPASAEASTEPSTTGGSRLQELEAELARRDAQQAPQATTPSPPVSQTATTPPTPPGASQAPPAPSPDPTATPGMRFQALPSITQLEPQDRIQKTRDFERLKPELQEEFLRSEEPAAGGLAVGGGPVAQSQPVTDPAALLAVGRGPRTAAPAASTAAPPPRGPASSTQIEPLQSGASELALSEFQRPHEQGIPLEAVPGMAVNTLGTVLGAAAGSPLGPVGSAAGAAIGGSLANRGSTWMGLTPQEKPIIEGSVVNLYPSDLLGAIPLGIAGTGAALKGAVRNLPGSNVARHEIAGERLRELGKRLGPEVPSDVLWQKAGQTNTAIATADVWRTAGDVVRRKSRTPNLSADDPALKAAQDLLSLAKKHGGPVPIQELDDARRNLVPHLRDPDVKRLYGAVIGDMDNAVTRGVPGAADLRGAIAATRKEHSLAELTDLWSQGKGIQQTSGDVTQVYGKRIQNQFENRMREDKTFAGAFTPAELADVRSTLKDVGKLTRITNPESQGPLRWLGSLTGAAYGVSSGDFWTTGAAILASQGASTILAQAMQSKVGRWALREAIREGNGKMTRGSLSAIAALLAREAAPEAPEPAPEQKP